MTNAIKIEIPDISNLGSVQARALAAFILEVNGYPRTEVSETRTAGQLSVTRTAPDVQTLKAIAEADKPDTGMPQASDVFGHEHAATETAATSQPSAAEVFGQGQAAAPSTTTPSPAPTAASLLPAAPAAAGSPPANVLTDIHGLPWDGRIHSSAKSCNQDGSWKAKRNVAPELKAQVESELRQLMAIPAPTAAPSTPPLPPVLPASGVAPAIPAAPSIAVPTPPAATVTAPGISTPSPTSTPASVSAPPPPTETPGLTFQSLVVKITGAIEAKQLTQARVSEVLAHHQLPALPSLIQRPDLIPVVHAALWPAQ